MSFRIYLKQQLSDMVQRCEQLARAADERARAHQDSQSDVMVVSQNAKEIEARRQTLESR